MTVETQKVDIIALYYFIIPDGENWECTKIDFSAEPK